jgi:mono/diheme cytochrome c family protein
MIRSAVALLLLLAAGPQGAAAQQAANARTYGPSLSKETAGGSDDVIRGVISEGTPRMPAFKHYLQRAEIDAIIAYLKTVPAIATR